VGESSSRLQTKRQAAGFAAFAASRFATRDSRRGVSEAVLNLIGTSLISIRSPEHPRRNAFAGTRTRGLFGVCLECG